jgi:AAHS family 3-hydroxyphenylpropionic acid transporter
MVFALKESQVFRQARAAATAAGRRINTFVALFGDGRATATLLLWVAFFFTTVVTYLLLNWLPVLMVAKGFSKPDAFFIQILFNLGSVVGSIFLGWLMQRKPSRWVLMLCYAGLAAGLVGMAAMGKDLTLASTEVALVGGFLLGAQYILYGLSPSFYRPSERGTGTGAAVALGRLGSAMGPTLAGILIAGGRSATEVLQALLPVTGVAALTALLLMFCKRGED